MDIQTKIDKVKVNLIRQMPFFGMMCAYLQSFLTNDPEFTTAGTNGREIIFNQEFADNLPGPELNWVFLHEIMHVALKHMWRIGNRDPKIWNMACDYAIHSMMVDEMDVEHLQKKGTFAMPFKKPENCLYDKKYLDMSAEEIYEELLKDPNIQQVSFVGIGGNSPGDHPWKIGGDKPGQGGSQDGSGTSSGVSEAEGENLSTEWDGKMISIATASQGCGNMPLGLGRLIKNITKPLKDWRTLLAEYLRPSPDDFGWSPPDYRYEELEFFMPAFTDENEGKLEDIVIWIDTSGSMDDEEIAKVFSEAVGILEQFGGKVSGWVGFFDHAAYDLERFEDITSLKKVKARGGGGTCFFAPFDKMAEQLKDDKVNCVVFMTDGYATWPPKTIAREIPVIWLLTSDKKDYLPDWGEYTYLRHSA